MSEDPEVIIRVEGRVGRLTLNRPQALHALTIRMCREMIAALSAWRSDPGVQLVLIDHTGERGFCAGGDIRTLAESGRGDGVLGRDFFRIEYQLNDLLFDYPKHLVSLMDGVVMGGGVGISRPCRFRVGTERTVFAMPETGIGLFPDVGGSWYLSRMPDHIGTWLALTGARLKAADAHFIGITNAQVAASRLDSFRQDLCRDPARLRILLKEYAVALDCPPLLDHHMQIERLFRAGGPEEIIAALDAERSEWASQQAAVLQTKSPLSLKVASRQLALGRLASTFRQVLAMEYRIAHRLVVSHDFLEGVRALILDKDNQPAWSPPSLALVSDAMVDAIFAPLAGDAEWSPLEMSLP